MVASRLAGCMAVVLSLWARARRSGTMGFGGAIGEMREIPMARKSGVAIAYLDERREAGHGGGGSDDAERTSSPG